MMKARPAGDRPADGCVEPRLRAPALAPPPGLPDAGVEAQRALGGPPLLSPWGGTPALTPGPPPPEWFASSTQSYILRDLDDTSVVEDGRKKLNTLAHYKVGPSPARPAVPPSLTSAF